MRLGRRRSPFLALLTLLGLAAAAPLGACTLLGELQHCASCGAPLESESGLFQATSIAGETLLFDSAPCRELYLGGDAGLPRD